MGSRNVAGMLTLLRFIVSVLVRRFRSRAVLELENLALRHQLHVLRRQRPGRPQLFAIDRLLWVWLYRLWPRCLEGDGLGQTGNGDPIAPSRVSALLALAFEVRTTIGTSRGS
jgi:hypothetical protein